MRRHAHRKISGKHLAFRDYADLFWLSCARPVPLLSVGLLLTAVGCSFAVQSLLLRRGEDVAHVLNPAATVLQILTCFRRCSGSGGRPPNPNLFPSLLRQLPGPFLVSFAAPAVYQTETARR